MPVLCPWVQEHYLHAACPNLLRMFGDLGFETIDSVHTLLEGGVFFAMSDFLSHVDMLLEDCVETR
jgi:hypothetical protein